MSALDNDEWGLTLEFLAWAALANVSPVLLVETDKSWSSLYHALGFPPVEEKFAPKPIAIGEVFKCLTAILPDFTMEHESFGILQTGRRNIERHSGEPAFEGVQGSVWQPRFYQTGAILIASMGMTFTDFVGKDEAEVAKKLMAADGSAKVVKQVYDGRMLCAAE